MMSANLASGAIVAECAELGELVSYAEVQAMNEAAVTAGHLVVFGDR